MDVYQLEKLRPLGKLETISAACHHLGFYNNVGLSAQYKISTQYTKDNLRQTIHNALEKVLKEHSILSAIPVNEDTAEPYFARLPSMDMTRSVHFIERRQKVGLNGVHDKELDAILQDQANTNFKKEYGILPFWRLLIVHAGGVMNEFTASFIFHHAIGDGIAGLTIHKSFLSALRTQSSFDSDGTLSSQYVIAANTQSLLPSLEELHPLPLPPASTTKPSENKSYNEWTGGLVQYPCKTLFRSLCISPRASTAFVQDCKKRNLTVTAALTSLIASILFEYLPRDTDALTCIIPVSLRPWLPRNIAADGMGTWIDAFKVKLFPVSHADSSSSSADRDIWQQAHQTSRQIQDYLKNISPTGEPYTGVAVFKTVPDISPVLRGAFGNPRDAAFELSNLGVVARSTSTIELADVTDDQDSWQMGKITFSRSAVVTGSALTVNVVTGGDGRMTLGFTWQEGVVDDARIIFLITGIEGYLNIAL